MWLSLNEPGELWRKMGSENGMGQTTGALGPESSQRLGEGAAGVGQLEWVRGGL